MNGRVTLLLIAATGACSDAELPANGAVGTGAAASAPVRPAAAAPDLVRLDAEAARLYALAEGNRRTNAERLTLTAARAEADAATEACAGRGGGADCLRAAEAHYIARLRREFTDLRADGAGISAGPVTYRCRGLDTPVGATFVNAEPSLVQLSLGDREITLREARSASGARYAGRGPGGAYGFWTKSGEATLSRPGAADTACTAEPRND